MRGGPKGGPRAVYAKGNAVNVFYLVDAIVPLYSAAHLGYVALVAISRPYVQSPIHGVHYAEKDQARYCYRVYHLFYLLYYCYSFRS